MTHHPHVHMIVPGGGISLDGKRWVSCRPGFFLPVRVLSRLFRRLFLEKLIAAHEAGRLQFFGDHAALADAQAFAAYLAPLRKTEWVVYAKRPFGGPQAVLAYLSRYTHRVAIANSRLIASTSNGVTFRWKDYRVEGRDRYKVMTLATDEFIRRFLIHVLPQGFHRIRHYGLFASGTRADNIARARELLAVAKPEGRAHRCRRRSQQADLSMLRRSHDHHRDLRARCNATASADSSNHRHQDRHLMTASQSRKSARRARCLSTGHGRARSDIQLSSQIARTIHSVRRRPAAHSRAASPSANSLDRLNSNHTPHPRHSNPHSPRRATLRAPSRGFLPWRFADAGPRARGATVMGPASENLHKTDIFGCRIEGGCATIINEKLIPSIARLLTAYMRQLSKLGGTMGSHSSAIQAYIRAKDENRPHLMAECFCPGRQPGNES